MCVEFLEGEGDGVSAKGARSRRESIDYKEVLDPETFALYAALRACRKELAEKEAVPPYAILTNEQLADVARRRCRTTAELEAVEGVGPGRVRKYGEALLAVIRQAAGPQPAGSEGGG